MDGGWEERICGKYMNEDLSLSQVFMNGNNKKYTI